MRYYLFIFATVAIAFAGWVFVPEGVVFSQDAYWCNQYGSGSTPPEGYGAAWSMVTSGKEQLLNSACSGGVGSRVVYYAGHESSSPYVYVYKNGYYYDVAWKSFSFTGTEVTDSPAWISKMGQYINTAPPQEDHFWLAFVCQFINGKWKCGCSSSSCTQGAWQLQKVKYVGGGTGGSGSGNADPTDREILLQQSVSLKEEDGAVKPIGTLVATTTLAAKEKIRLMATSEIRNLYTASDLVWVRQGVHCQAGTQATGAGKLASFSQMFLQNETLSLTNDAVFTAPSAGVYTCYVSGQTNFGPTQWSAASYNTKLTLHKQAHGATLYPNITDATCVAGKDTASVTLGSGMPCGQERVLIDDTYKTGTAANEHRALRILFEPSFSRCTGGTTACPTYANNGVNENSVVQAKIRVQQYSNGAICENKTYDLGSSACTRRHCSRRLIVEHPINKTTACGGAASDKWFQISGSLRLVSGAIINIDTKTTDTTVTGYLIK